ncbi:hypothetical protein SLA_5916 [Streptomyces laurentii]|uniref:Uncharacterized protein n=1 Tax=Streptomyces laurentii TaxID=39478 RepID=A0A160P6T2_STRLU|nr:hypothetical protein SLA_5916 [Streptomyces laurentii]
MRGWTFAITGIAVLMGGFILWIVRGTPIIPLKTAEIEGSWSGPNGGHIEVRPDGSAELQHIENVFTRCAEPDENQPSDVYSGPATWKFDTFPDESPGIRFDYRVPGDSNLCSIYLAVRDRKGGRGYITHDGARYKRTPAEAG